jgi:hypothetical protein
MRHGTPRIIATVVVGTLVAGMLSGAFLLSTTSHSDLAELRSAAQRTLDAASYRVTVIVKDKATGFEEYGAPDRVRTRFSRVVAANSAALSPSLETISVGTTAYAQEYCPSDGESAIVWSRSSLAVPERSTPYARMIAALIDSAADAQLVTRTNRGDTYVFSPSRAVEDQGAVVEVDDARAIVEHGRLRDVAITQRITVGGSTQRSRALVHFSRYGTVHAITAPADSSTEPLQCRGGTALSASP